eukprot:544709_1
MITTQNKIDMDTFKQSNDGKCDEKSDDPSQTCNVIKRLITGLQYYTLLDVQNEPDNKDEFNNFICDIYHTFLDDYIHLINIHGYKLENINKSLLRKQVKACDVKKCIFTGRHEGTNDTEKISDFVLYFYENTMDSLHFYLFHLFDVGLRVSKSHNDDTKRE